MGGNDTHDKYGRPYELDDGVEKLYDRLNDLRDSVSAFRSYLDKEIEELSESDSGINIELAQTQEILDRFIEIFSSHDY